MREQCWLIALSSAVCMHSAHAPGVVLSVYVDVPTKLKLCNNYLRIRALCVCIKRWIRSSGIMSGEGWQEPGWPGKRCYASAPVYARSPAGLSLFGPDEGGTETSYCWHLWDNHTPLRKADWSFYLQIIHCSRRWEIYERQFRGNRAINIDFTFRPE